MSKHDPFAALKDDGLTIPKPIGTWAKQKYQLLSSYASLFSTSMKDSWDALVYVDLFASAGRATIRDSGNIVLTSPMLALEVPHRFSRYVFAEIEKPLIDALKSRVESSHPDVDVRYIPGDVNNNAESILESLSVHSKSHKVLSFCFIDPCAMSNLQFKTIESLAARFMDFLILIPTGMDAARNQTQYERQENEIVDRFMGTIDWRHDWEKTKGIKPSFSMFIANYFSQRMNEMDFKYGGLHESVLIRSDEKNLPLYRLGFYSRHPLANTFWRQAKKYGIGQQGLFE